jgi:hypothetical protein
LGGLKQFNHYAPEFLDPTILDPRFQWRTNNYRPISLDREAKRSAMREYNVVIHFRQAAYRMLSFLASAKFHQSRDDRLSVFVARLLYPD